MTDETTTQILRDIRDEIVGLRGDQVHLKDGLTELKDELSVTRTELTGELAELKDELSATRIELKEELAATRTVVTAELVAMRAELKAEIAGLRAEVRAELGELNDTVEALGRYAKNITRRVDKAIEELRERVAKLEARRKN